MQLSDEEKERLESLISQLEILTGQVMARDSRMSEIVTRMLEQLNGLRSTLGLIKRRG